MQLLEQEMDIGLSPATHRTADVKMFPTYVRNIADGTETGQIMALDLGGTNFRVILVKLLPQSKVELTSKNFVIPQSIMLGEGVNVSCGRMSVCLGQQFVRLAFPASCRLSAGFHEEGRSTWVQHSHSIGLHILLSLPTRRPCSRSTDFVDQRFQMLRRGQRGRG